MSKNKIIRTEGELVNSHEQELLTTLLTHIEQDGDLTDESTAGMLESITVDLGNLDLTIRSDSFSFFEEFSLERFLEKQARKAVMIEKEFLNPINREKSAQATEMLNIEVKSGLRDVLPNALILTVCTYNYIQIDKAIKFISKEDYINLSLQIKMGHPPGDADVMNQYYSDYSYRQALQQTAAGYIEIDTDKQFAPALESSYSGSPEETESQSDILGASFT